MKVLAFDIGGTKIAAALVSSSGKILKEGKTATPGVSWGQAKKAILSLGREIGGGFRAVGISSAGPLHAGDGVLLDPTNVSWGRVEIVRELKKAFRVPVVLDNDAACAAIGEHWRGEFRKTADLLVLTLGTGLGVGLITDHACVRGGRGLHPEGGHLLLSSGDRTAPCGCGNFGCAEAYLAGSHFVRRVGMALGKPDLTIQEVLDMAKEGWLEPFFLEYSERLAQFLCDYIVLSYPRTVVLAGSFASLHPFFLPKTKAKLRDLVKRRLRTIPDLMPEIGISKLENRAGLIGAAKIALNAVK